MLLLFLPRQKVDPNHVILCVCVCNTVSTYQWRKHVAYLHSAVSEEQRQQPLRTKLQNLETYQCWLLRCKIRKDEFGLD